MAQLPEGTVTILFTDVVGSTDLTTSRGDEAAREIMRAQRDLTRQQVEEHSGHEIKGLGDGSMVAFTTARQAVACSVGIQRALEEHNRQQPLNEQIEVRIGLNTGEVIHEEDDLFGEAVNAASRIAAKAKGGQILVSDMVKGLLGRTKDVELVDRGRFRLRGFPERWRLHEAVWQETTTAAPMLAERTPFVGREAERAELRRLLDKSAKGEGSLVLVGGEPGVGKTRLAQELAAEATGRSHVALGGRCYEMEGSLPYVPFVEMVEAAARTFPPDALRAALGESAPEVATLMPQLRRTFPDIPASPELPPDQVRRYLFNGTREFLARAAEAQPLVLVLDDIQWADEATLLLLQHIAQQLHEMPVLIVCTYRDAAVDTSRPLNRTLEELNRQRLAHQMSLKRLSKEMVSALLKAISGKEPPVQLVEVVYRETEGNAFFVEEVVKHLAEEGKLFDERGEWRADLEVSEVEVPEGVRLVIERRLERVDEVCRNVLTAAAVIGPVFGFDLLEAIGQTDADSLLDAIDDAERANLIASTGEAAEARFGFVHELIRQTLLAGTSAARRQRLHLLTAEAMELVYAEELDDHSADLAHHLSRAGSIAPRDKKLRFLLLAGEKALDSAAYGEALSHFEDALSLVPSERRGDRAGVLYLRGQAKRAVGDWPSALADWRQALDSYERIGDPASVGKVCADISQQLLWGGKYFDALEISRRGLAQPGWESSPEGCGLLGMAGMTLSLAGSYDAAQRLISEAVELGGRLVERRWLGRCLLSNTMHHWAYMQLTDAEETGRRSADLLRSASDSWSVAIVLGLLQYALLLMGRLDDVDSVGQELQPLASRLGNQGASLFAGRSGGTRSLMVTGDLDAFEEFAVRDLDRCRSGGIFAESNSHTWLGLVHFWRGDWDRALEAHRLGADLETPGFFAGADQIYLFLCHAYREEGGEARAILHRLREGSNLVTHGLGLTRGLGWRQRFRLMRAFLWLNSHAGTGDSALFGLRRKRGGLPSPGQANSIGAWTILLGAIEGLVVLGDRREAYELYDLAIEAIGTGALLRSPGDRLLQTVAAMAAAAGREWDKAEDHYRTALRQANDLPHKLEQPEVRRWYARMLIDRDGPGDRDKAFRLLTEAVTMYREIGMPRHVEMAEAMLAEPS